MTAGRANEQAASGIRGTVDPGLRCGRLLLEMLAVLFEPAECLENGFFDGGRVELDGNSD